MKNKTQDKKLAAAKNIARHIAEISDARFCLKLWDGSVVPLGKKADPNYYFSINRSDILGSLLRRPTLENVLSHYATGNIDFHGGRLMDFADVVRDNPKSKWHRNINKGYLLGQAIPLLLAPSRKSSVDHTFDKDATGRKQERRDNKEFIQFHYDVSNDFYKLFLDPELVYSCAYFTDWRNSLAQAQRDKLDMICRKLRLKPGEMFLDIGCGWGALICHAAKHYGVRSYGVTLSREQFDYAQQKIDAMGLKDKVTIELKDYTTIKGKFDKIASIGMFEHVGIANFPTYFGKLSALLKPKGILLNHGIARRAKSSKRKFNKIHPARGWILKHIFPGSELDHLGHTVECMENKGFEIHDVENWREHYARTLRFWCDRLSDNQEKAVEYVGIEKYRLWIAYLAGVSFGFEDGSLCLYQIVASNGYKGPSQLPPTRADLYHIPQKLEDHSAG